MPDLDAETQTKIIEIGTADLLVGIPSFNNARTIGHVVRMVEAGLAKYFPDRKAVIMNADGGSTDGTQELVRSASSDPGSVLTTAAAARIVTAYPGISGKGSAFLTIALGDSPNDLPMLLAADEAVLIARSDGTHDPETLSALPRAYKAGPGPAGWAAAVSALLVWEGPK